jgi:hypothetical protein
MRFLPLSLLLVASTAAAKPFAVPTKFESCQQSTMFACGMRDEGGHSYGTAKAFTVCSGYVFAPDGTFTSTSDGLPIPGETGRYVVNNGRVTLTTEPGDPAEQPRTFELKLSADGKKLGDLTRK